VRVANAHDDGPLSFLTELSANRKLSRNGLRRHQSQSPRRRHVARNDFKFARDAGINRILRRECRPTLRPIREWPGGKLPWIAHREDKLLLVEPASHDILLAVRRRAFILIFALVVSFLVAQPVPARVQRAAGSYAILWQSENRVRRPAVTSTIQITRRRHNKAVHVLPDLVARALQRRSLFRNFRAPPVFSLQI
jgi:hypothetical protein